MPDDNVNIIIPTDWVLLNKLYIYIYIENDPANYSNVQLGAGSVLKLFAGVANSI